MERKREQKCGNERRWGEHVSKRTAVGAKAGMGTAGIARMWALRITCARPARIVVVSKSEGGVVRRNALM